MKIDIGINGKDRGRTADGLSHLLAGGDTLYLTTHNFHWNVTGPMFNTLHPMFEQPYKERALAVDLIAERIPANGFPAPGTYREFSALTHIREPESVVAANDMIKQLVLDQEAAASTVRSLLEGEGRSTARVSFEGCR